MDKIIIALDLGTTGNRAIAFSQNGQIMAQSYRKFSQYNPKPGWVEQNAEELYFSCEYVLRDCLEKLDNKCEICGIGIANQRETTVVWERETSKPIAEAIVWQDRRTSDFCEKNAVYEKWLRERTGLFLDPYFSATKIAWLLDNVPEARSKAEAGALCFGTVDSWMVWKLTKGKVHATDASNASRTLLYDLATNEWNDELCAKFSIPKILLPKIFPSFFIFGALDSAALPNIPIASILGDQQASLYGHNCLNVLESKITFGTGAFLLVNTGDDFSVPRERLLRTAAWRESNKTTYALEGSLFNAGSAVEWLINLGLLKNPEQIDSILDEKISPDDPICVPAFSGLGAPHWNPRARAAFVNISSKTSPHNMVKAILEGIAWQVENLLAIALPDLKIQLRVDGGLTKSKKFLGLLSAIIERDIVCGHTEEMSAWGAAKAAAYTMGCWKTDGMIKNGAINISQIPYPREQRKKLWKEAIGMVKSV